MPNTRILVVDDDPASLELLVEALTNEGHELVTSDDGERALVIAREQSVDAIVLDLDLPGMPGIEVLQHLRTADASLPVLILTGRADIPTAIRATELGAFAYLTKSPDMDEVAIVLRRALERRSLEHEVERLRKRLSGGADVHAAMGPSEHVRRIVEQITQVADSKFTVLLHGETGTGKEVVARAIHRHSSRHDQPFVAIDCGAIPENLIESELFGHEKGAFTGAGQRRVGQFQAAQGGTCFLDEIANLPMSLQVKLLRVLQERELQPLGGRESMTLDVRFVAATNADLTREIAAGKFRQDLFYRLAEFTISLPPLRARVEDVEFLARRFAQEASGDLRRPARDFTKSALDVLRAHTWPGNVRELRNVARQAVLQCDSSMIAEEHVRAALVRANTVVEPYGASAPSHAVETAATPTATDGRSLREIAAAAVERAERAAITAALAAAGGNKSEAARRLQTDYKTLLTKIRLYALK